ncbi:hypothetical protein ACXYMU_05000 [Pontibacter sp. CAU 1760]
MRGVIKCLILILPLICSYNALACICSSSEWNIERVYDNIKQSDLIFIGDVISENGNSYAFRVVEVFKGEIKADTVFGEAREGCSMTPYIDGLWVIYTDVDEKGIIDFDVCSLSRSLTTFSPLPPYPDSAITESLYTSIRGKSLPLAMRDWVNEYTLLLNLKDAKNVVGKETNQTEPVKLEDKKVATKFIAYIAEPWL